MAGEPTYQELQKRIQELETAEAEREKALEELRESEERLRTIVENSKAGYFFIDRDGKFQGVNDAWMRMHGYASSDEIIGQHFSLTQFEPELKQAQKILDRVLGGESIQSGEFSRRLKDGSLGYHTFSAIPVVSKGEIIGVEGFLIDTTVRKNAEQKLRQSEETHRALIESLPDIVMRFDGEARHLFVSENVKAVVALSAEQFIGKTHRELGFPEGMCLFWEQAIREVFDSDAAYETQFSFQGERGQTVFNWRLVPEFDAQGRTQSVLSIARDITAQKQAEQNYQMLFREMLDGFALHEIILDETGRPADYRFIAVNPAFERLTGLKAENILGRNVLEVLPDTERHWIEAYGRVALAGEPAFFENYHRELDKHFKVTAFSPLPKQFACIFADVTERKRMEEALRESEKKYRLLFENAPLGIIHYDQDGTITDLNHAFASIIGAPKEKIIGFKMRRQLRDEKMLQALTASLSGRIGYYEGEYISVIAGKKTPVRAFFRSLFSETGEFVGGISIFENYTEKYRAEQERQASLSFLRILMDAIPNPVFYKDVDGRYMGCNKACEDLWGRPREGLIGKSVFDLHPRDLAEKYHAMDAELFQHPGVQVYETSMVRSDGSRRAVQLHKATFSRPDGTLGGLIGVAVDVTERQLMEKALRKSEEQYRTLIDNSPIGIYRTTAGNEGSYLAANPAFLKMFGFNSFEELKQWTPAQRYIDPAERKIFSDRLLTQGGISVEHRLKRKDGTPIWGSITANVVRGENGKALYFDCTMEDITDRKLTEKALQESEAKYRAIVEDQTELVSRFLPDGTLTFANQAYCRYFGQTEAELVGHTFWHHLPLNDQEKFRKYLSNFTEQQPISRIEHRVIDYRGEVRWQQWIDRAILSELGEIVEFQAVGRDVTELKKAQKALQESEKHHRLLFNSVKDALFVHEGPSGGFPGKFIEVNDSACERLGYTKEEFLKMSPLDIDAPETIDHIPAIMQKLREDEEVLWEGVHMTRDGKRIPVEINNHLFEIDGKPMIFSSARDISDRKKAEEEKQELEAQLRRAQKLEAIGTLAGGIAHDFNNILAPIIGFTEMALDDTPQLSSAHHDLAQVLKAAYRAKDLVRQILAFSRHGEEQQRKPVDVSKIVKEALKLLRASLPTTIEIRQSIQRGIAMVDATQIHQVVVNLCTNASHAMDEKGILDVSLKRIHLNENDLMSPSFLDLEPGPYLQLSVTDTGHGIDAEIIERIFDPYFTTKPVGKGSGLGLAVVHGIIKRHEGAISVRSESDKGSTFDVYIPRIKNAREDPKEEILGLPTGMERILLVDDEEMVAELGAAMLERLGYLVTAKTSALDALDVFRSSPDEFDLVIMDYTMPYLTGTDLSVEILKVRTDIPIILCTGYSEKVNKEMIDNFGIKALVLKPFDRKQLAQLVRSVLEENKD